MIITTLICRVDLSIPYRLFHGIISGETAISKFWFNSIFKLKTTVNQQDLTNKTLRQARISTITFVHFEWALLSDPYQTITRLTADHERMKKIYKVKCITCDREFTRRSSLVTHLVLNRCPGVEVSKDEIKEYMKKHYPLSSMVIYVY